MRMNCAFSCNDAYVQHAGVCMLSIFENNRDIEEIIVYFIDNEISDGYKNQLYEIADDYKTDGLRKVIFIPLNDISKSLKVKTDFCRSTYGKLFLAEINDVNRILCFDCDTVCAGSLKDLLTIDMNGCSVLGVQDTVNPFFVREIGMSRKDRYINCGGVIVINLKQWREEDTEKKFIDYVTEWSGNPPFVDQGTINKICKTGILSPKYNVINPMFMYSVKQIKDLFKIDTYYSQKEIDEAKKSPIIIHYTGEMYNRPWCYGCTHPLKNVYLKYLDKSPWKGNIIKKELSTNCKIQNFIYKKCPYFVYKMMIRFIEYRHRLMKRNMKGDTESTK